MAKRKGSAPRNALPAARRADIAVAWATAEDLHSLAEGAAPPCVSIYLPLAPSFPAVKENPVRYRHAVDRALERLSDAGLEPHEIASLRSELARVPTDVRDLESPARALAVFLDRARLRAYALPQALPEQVTVGPHFALRPLLRALRADCAYGVLALSVNRVALFEGSARGLRPARLEGVPASLEDALGTQLTGRDLQARSAGPSGYPRTRYGRGGAPAERELDLERFHRALATALERGFSQRDTPLVLATDATHDGALRRMLKLPALVAESAPGNPEQLDPQELHERSWPIIARELERRERELAARFERLRNRGKGTTELERIAGAARAGTIQRLWIDSSASIRGRLDPTTGRFSQDPSGDSDLLDALAAEVIRTRGDVIVVEGDAMPAQSLAAAELR